MSRLRNFCFTINNWTQDDIDRLALINCTYMVYGKEIGEQKTPHLQGYCELTSRIRFKKLKSSIPNAHIQKRKGTAKQASDYCKKDGDFTVTGVMSRPGKRNDLTAMYELIKEGKDDLTICDSMPSTYMRYYKSVDRVRMLFDQADTTFRPVKVRVFVGQAGSGKTRACYDEFPDLYRVCSDSNTLWFDGYHGQETILFDDFYGGIKYGRFLQLLDGYRFQLPIKGGFTWKKWTTVLITSNQQPCEWYKKGLTPALARRITCTTNM